MCFDHIIILEITKWKEMGKFHDAGRVEAHYD